MSAERQYRKLPEWVAHISLKKAVQAQIGEFERIVSITPSLDDMRQRNNTILLPIRVRAMLQNHSLKRASFMLKAENTSGYKAKILTQFKLFQREHHVYHYLLPRFQKLYRDAGRDVSFGPKPYKLDKKIGVSYILLDDLKVANYRNASRLKGFDFDQIKEVLKKLAEFHAVSAVYIDTYGMYDKIFTVGVYTKSNKNILREINDSEPFLSQLRRWRVGNEYYAKLANTDRYLVERLIEAHKVKPNEFNVLNHSDCWTNNVMFKYAGFGNIEDTKLLDYQGSKYGSPANDLIFAILSSVQKDIKLDKFDYFIQFYYFHLRENLKLLKYQHALPQLENIQNACATNGLVAYCVVSKVLPIVMLDKFEDDGSNDAAYQSRLKCAMFTNRKYIQAMTEILPWMDERGYLATT